MSAVTY